MYCTDRCSCSYEHYRHLPTSFMMIPVLTGTYPVDRDIRKLHLVRLHNVTVADSTAALMRAEKRVLQKVVARHTARCGNVDDAFAVTYEYERAMERWFDLVK